MTVNEVAKAISADLIGDGSGSVTDVTHDSRQAKPGSLFVAIRGELFDAHKFVPQVIEQGAAGVLSELERPSDFNGAWLQVKDVRRAMALAAAAVHHHPSRELQLVGITGTNGKTTTAYLVASIPEAAGEPVAMTGTVEYRLGKERKKAGRTTPEATDMQRMLRQAVEIGCKTAVMECSSQAMDFHRCDELDYAVAVFSNLTRDHLDYHKTMENYWYAKQRLFDGRLGSRPKTSVINVDDPYGIELANRLEQEGLRVVRYAVKSDSGHHRARSGILAGRYALSFAHPGRRDRFSFAAGWAAACLQHPGRGGERPGARLQPGCDHEGAGEMHRRAGTI